MNLESELFTLQDSNSKLVAALHEANANVEQWKKQLTAYQEETERLRDQVRPPRLYSVPLMFGSVFQNQLQPRCSGVGPTFSLQGRLKFIPVQGKMKMSAGLADFGSRL